MPSIIPSTTPLPSTVSVAPFEPVALPQNEDAFEYVVEGIPYCGSSDCFKWTTTQHADPLPSSAVSRTNARLPHVFTDDDCNNLSPRGVSIIPSHDIFDTSNLPDLPIDFDQFDDLLDQTTASDCSSHPWPEATTVGKEDHSVWGEHAFAVV